jgi:hypothetical protein
MIYYSKKIHDTAKIKLGQRGEGSGMMGASAGAQGGWVTSRTNLSATF